MNKLLYQNLLFGVNFGDILVDIDSFRKRFNVFALHCPGQSVFEKKVNDAGLQRILGAHNHQTIFLY